MNVHRLNGSLRVSRINAEQHLPSLTLQYERLILQAAREAATTLVATSQTMAVTAATSDAPNWQLPPDGILLAIATLTNRATRRLGKLHRRIVEATARPPLARVGIAWDVTHPLAQNLLERTGARTGELLAAAIQPTLSESIAESYAAGLSVVDAAEQLRLRFVETAPAQAEMLARTDLNSLSNGGSVMAAQMVGVTTKIWLTAEDDRVRETHADADGQEVPIDQPFMVGGEMLDYPGDPGGSDEEVCNCRCTVIYSDPEMADPETASALPRIPARGFMVAAPMPATERVDWVSDVAFEGTATEDGRYMLADSLTWREAPLTLMAMTVTADGHDGAFVAGRMDAFEKDSSVDMNGDPLPEGVTAIRAHGIFDNGGEDGANIARLVGDETMRGISVDLAVDDWAFRDPDTGDLIEPDDATDQEMERAFFGELQYAVRSGTILAATVCPTPAFADARIALTASADGRRVLRVWAPMRLATESLTASAAGLAPVKPPAEWFTLPEARKPTPLTVTKDGQVYGHMALWESCHTGYPGQCIPPPRSQSGYTYFHLGEVETAEGQRVACGSLTLEALHADTDRPLSNSAVRAHYEHTGVVAAYVRATDGRHGIWVAGTLRANLSERHARDLMGAKPSGDWRQTRPGGPLEMLGVHAVNEPGYPVPRLVASALLPSGGKASLEFGEPLDSGRVPARGFARV